MRVKYSKEHAEIARQIRLAKKRMFKAHREGVDLPRAADSFIAEIREGVARIATAHNLNTTKKGSTMSTQFSNHNSDQLLSIGIITDAAEAAAEKNLQPREGRNEYHQALIDLGVDDADLNRYASYFGVCFEHDTKQMTVLISFLNRLRDTSESEMIDVRNIIDQINDRLFSYCAAGYDAARSFSDSATERATAILEKGVA